MDPEAPSTQLADNRPQFDNALRIALPVNVPPRNEKKSRDALIQINAFSPGALASGKKALTGFVASAIAENKSTIAFNAKAVPPSVDESARSEDANVLTTIRDLSVLAFSSKRAGKKDVEATAYLSLGVIYDNQTNLLNAIENYKLYLQICEEIGDVVGSALGCNCLGVNYMLLVSPPSDAGIVHGVRNGPHLIEYLNLAIFYHGKHLEIGPDVAGRFVANTNLGLCYAMIGDVIQGAKHQQDALRIAIKMQTLYGQSIAVGNLGMLAIHKGDYATAKTCFEQVKEIILCNSRSCILT